MSDPEAVPASVTAHPLDDVAALATAISRMRAREARPGERLLIGIVGAPGAGKSTLAAELVGTLPGAVVLPMDGFHLPQARLVELGRRDRMGAPDTFDVEAFVGLLQTLHDPGRQGRTLWAPGFDRAIDEPVLDAIDLGYATTVIVEGNYLLHDADGWQRVAPLLHASVAVRVDDTVRQQRLIARHIAHGKTPTAARGWALGPDEANARLIAPGLDRADYSLSG